MATQFDYVIIADNAIQQCCNDHEQAQLAAKQWSEGRYDQAKVVYLPNRTVQGSWYMGMRVN